MIKEGHHSIKYIKKKRKNMLNKYIIKRIYSTERNTKGKKGNRTFYKSVHESDK